MGDKVQDQDDNIEDKVKRKVIETYYKFLIWENDRDFNAFAENFTHMKPFFEKIRGFSLKQRGKKII